MSEDEHGACERWDFLCVFLWPWLWSCFEVAFINSPTLILEGFLRHTVGYVTGHEFGEGGH